MTTAAEVIAEALHLFGIIDQTEDPTPNDIAKCVITLNNMLRNEQADGACQYFMKTVPCTLPAGVFGQIYTFVVGPGGALDADAVAVKAMWINDLNLTVNRETRQAPKADVVRTMTPGRIMKWHQERQADGTVLVYAWQAPNRAVPALIEYGGRCPALTAADGSDVVPIPSEGIHDVTLLLGLLACGMYGRDPNAVSLVAQRAMAVDARWKSWARGQQWIRMVRS